ncbi:DUF4184 family protein [Paenibacillus crassostreae]|uniref:Uncharacterized protein n=1 Tax=Paenibacillus crassostreae TaxID=1763538 RepID=A0A167B6X4_9BACL|nr:DUF4184 family protein [Paenibacillus crassostreae]AOZ93120.1 hypothetical protein LPB68_13470 [Paenibacillus crassostreae]OAB71791.1 hypothetical protein PNBC_17420 [Paenibacillus crassostreae]
MPFTFAHPLYIVPLKLIKPRYINLAGLILGSMSPDFEYFIALEPYQTIGHTHLGLLLQALPLSVIFILLISGVMKTLVSHLPSTFNIDIRLYTFLKFFDYRDPLNWLKFLISVVIGFYSHLFVDAFTHLSGYFVMRYPFFQNSYFNLPMYKILQYSLSIIGMLVQLLLILLLVINTPYSISSFRRVPSKRKILYWSSVCIITISVMIAKLALTTSPNILGIIIVSSISGLILGILIASILFRERIKGITF